MWLTLIKANKGLSAAIAVILGLIIYIIVLELSNISLNKDLNKAEATITKVKGLLKDANDEVDGLSHINDNNIIELAEIKDEYDSKLRVCENNTNIVKKKEKTLLDLIDNLRGDIEVLSVPTVYDVPDCKVFIQESSDINDGTEDRSIVDLLNNLGDSK